MSQKLLWQSLNRSIQSTLPVLAALAGSLMLTGVAVAAADLSGVWQGVRQQRAGNGVNLGLPFDPSTLPGTVDDAPLTPEYAAKFKAAVDARRSGTPFADPTASCLPGGVPRMMGMIPFPMEILMTPGKVTIVAEWMSQVRHIYTGGRGHPKADELEPTFNGHSIGRWEGDTLVVDTIGLRSDTLISQQGLGHSDVTRVIERFRLKGELLENAITIIDPKMLTHPWTVIKTYTRAPKGRFIQEYVCAEGLLNRDSKGR